MQWLWCGCNIVIRCRELKARKRLKKSESTVTWKSTRDIGGRRFSFLHLLCKLSLLHAWRWCTWKCYLRQHRGHSPFTEPRTSLARYRSYIGSRGVGDENLLETDLASLKAREKRADIKASYSADSIYRTYNLDSISVPVKFVHVLSFKY